MPADLDVHLVLDNAATHKTRLLHDGFVKRPRWRLHVTPTSASWLNLLEAGSRCIEPRDPTSSLMQP